MKKIFAESQARPAGQVELAARVMATLHLGVDEAGRGCLAGPVVAGAVLAEPGFDFAASFPGLTDSKALSEKKRAHLRQAICASSLQWSLGVAWPGEIDQVNILNATFRAMSRAVLNLLERGSPGLTPAQCTLYIDGSQPILLPQWRAACGRRNLEPPAQKTLVKGDRLLPSISAASILAKTWRDRLMLALDRRYPGYGFAGHKGYGTGEHLEALRRLGPSPQHRRTFAGVLPEAGGEAPRQEQFALF